MAVKERISSIDTVRGVALLGLLTMNLVGMSMPIGAYLSPLAFQSEAPFNDFIFSVFFVLADQKFMGIFSLLFGASLLLLIEKMQDKGKPSLGVHYRRNFLLLLLGILHGVFLWEGDILMIYGFCALLLYPLHRSSPYVLLIIGGLLLALASYSAGGFNGNLSHYDAEQIRQAEEFLKPTAATIAELKSQMSGSYQDILNYRLGEEDDLQGARFELELLIFLTTFYRALGMMCLGMALYKWRFVQGQHSMGFYQKSFLAGMLLALPLALYACYLGYSSGWSVQAYFSHWGIMPFTIIASTIMVIAYVAGISWLCKKQWAMPLQLRIQAMGQTALSNYLLQSLIGTTVMYGYGLGLWGELARWQLLVLMLLIWGLQLYLSPLWLRYFRQGPVEYLWRCMTYFSLEPLRR